MGFLGEIREAVEIAQKADNLDLYRQMLDVQRQAHELYEENLELRNAVQQREDEIERLKNRMKVSATVVPDGNLYFTEDGEGERDGPFCTRCWDVDDLLIRVIEGRHGTFRCPECTIQRRRNKDT